MFIPEKKINTNLDNIVTIVVPLTRKAKVTDNIEVTIKRINDLNREQPNPKSLLMDNGNVLIGENGIEVFNAENNTFKHISDIKVKSIFKYKPGEYMITMSIFIIQKKTNFLSFQLKDF
ncbi:MAG: hypothetical protein AB7V50_03490 [Vampirovibrionia bacterium]